MESTDNIVNNEPATGFKPAGKEEGTINFAPKTERELAKEHKSRRTEKIIGAIGDGLMSLSNLFFTSKGAPTQFGGDNKKGTKPTFLLNAIAERHKAEDSDYEKKFKEWKKGQDELKNAADKKTEEEEKNRRVQLYQDFGIKESNWSQPDFIEQLYSAICDWNTDESLTQILNSFQFTYEPIWEWMGSNWAYEEGHDKKIDLFKGKSGTYLKRDLIETLFGDETWTTPENRQNLINNVIEFENSWIPLKK